MSAADVMGHAALPQPKMVTTPELERSRPVGDYIEALVRAAASETPPLDADDWIDAVKCCGLGVGISYDAYSGSPVSFVIHHGKDERCVAAWPRLEELGLAIGHSQILAVMHARSVADPLFDLVRRTRNLESSIDDQQFAGVKVSDLALRRLDFLNEEQQAAPAATSFDGVIAGVEYGAGEVADYDLCGDGVLRGALEGLKALVEGPDPLFDLIAEYEAGNKAYCDDPKTGQGDEAYDAEVAARSFEPPWRRLQTDPPAATSLRGVAAALKLCCDHGEGDDVVLPVAAAAAKFFDKALIS